MLAYLSFRTTERPKKIIFALPCTSSFPSLTLTTTVFGFLTKPTSNRPTTFAGDCCECTCVGDDVDPRVICLDGNYECLDTSASCFGAPTPAPTPGVDPPTEGDDAIVTEDSSASLSRATSATVAATSAFVATALGGVVAGMLG